MADNIPEALFLDRDGTLIEHISYLCDPERVSLIQGIERTLKYAKDLGCKLFLHTNQSGVGRGYFEMKQAIECNLKLIELVGAGEDLFDGICIAPENPNQDELVYRKPICRFELEMAERHGLDLGKCYFVGDSISDVDTGVAAGMRSVGLWQLGSPDSIRLRFLERDALVYPSLAIFWRELMDSDSLL